MIISRVAFVALLVVIAGTSHAACPPDPDGLVAAEAPDVLLTPEVRAAAARFDFDPVRLYEFVRNEFEYQVYFGLLKGPVGALHVRAGNEYDLAALLVSLLRVSEDTNDNCSLDPNEDLDGDGRLDGRTPARFVRGRIRVTADQAARWTDAESGDGAFGYWFRAYPIPSAVSR